MKKLGLSLLVGTAAALLVTVTAMPASAAPGDTVTTFDLAGGDLTVAVIGTATLTDGASGTDIQSISGSLGAVTVTDDRGVTGSWNASAISSTFVGALTTHSTSTDVTYSAGTGTGLTGTSNAISSGSTSIATSAEVFGAAAVSGNNAVTFTPTLTVDLPAGALADTYTGTVTTSVA